MGKEGVVYIYNGMLFSHKKERNLAICNNMVGSRGYYTKWNKSDREKQLPYDINYMWNVKNKTNEKTKWKQTHKYKEEINGCLPEGWRIEGRQNRWGN